MKIVGNLPYYVSTPLIAKFTSALSPASRLVLTLQLELARRLNATPRTKDYGAMTVCVNRRWKASSLRKLPASVFFPAPRVDSAVIALDRRAERWLHEHDYAIMPPLGLLESSSWLTSVAFLLAVAVNGDHPRLVRAIVTPYWRLTWAMVAVSLAFVIAAKTARIIDCLRKGA